MACYPIATNPPKDNRSLMTADFHFKNLGKPKSTNAAINGLQLHLSRSLPILMEKFPKRRTHRHGTARMPSINQQRLFGKSPATRPLKASRKSRKCPASASRTD